MKKLLVVLVIQIFIWGKADVLFSQQYYTPADFNLSIKRGNINKSKMSSSQKDTILIDTYNYEDNFFDIAILYRSVNEIRIYKNCVNGFLTEYKKIELSKDKSAFKIENDSPTKRDLLNNPYLKSGINIIYKDKSSEKISDYKINKISDDPVSKAPLRNFLDDAGVFVFDLSFIEVWRSERNGSPSYNVITGDIDNDGRNEVIYTFFPIRDSTPVFFPQRTVVFESVGNNQYRIDWDTISYDHALYTALPDITDFDRNGQKEFFAISYDNLYNDLVAGLFECSGEGKYKFYRSDELYFQGPLTKIITVDTVNFYNNSAGMYICFSASSIPSQINELALISKSVVGGYYFRRKTPQNITLNGFVYDMEILDFDSDGKNEIILGDTQFSTDYIGYLDSTGINMPWMQGYEYKEITPNAPISGGWLKTKDLDGDNNKELIVCGIGNGTGSIGVVKSLGNKTFQTMWWDSTEIVAGPNLGIDDGFIDNKYSILYPCVRYSGPLDFLNLITYTKNDIYSFYKSSFRVIDSAALVGARFYDIDKDNKINIISTGGIEVPNAKFYLFDFEQQGIISIENTELLVPENFTLYQNYPNPFNPVTKIAYNLPTDEFVKIKIYDALGKEVMTIVNEYKEAGKYNVSFNGVNFSSGIYYYRIEAGSFIQTKKMLLIK